MRATTLRQGQHKKPIHPASWERLGRNGLYLALGLALAAIILNSLGHPGAEMAVVMLAGMAFGISFTCSFIGALAKADRLRNFTENEAAANGSRRTTNAERSELAKDTPVLPMDDQAVSPVVGVILMVAITVVLAVVVFLLVQNLSKNTPEGIVQASFDSNPPATTSLSWRLISQSEPFTWSTCTMKDVAGASATFTVNGAAPGTTKSTIGDAVAVSGLTTKTSYDYLLACAGSAVGHLTGTTL